MTHHLLDARQLICPMPVIRTQNQIAALSAGDTLEITVTDPGALHDIPAWCRVHGHHVLSTASEGRDIRIIVRVGDV
jgi:tRNA 2-thiouridine synthesizing protein A